MFDFVSPSQIVFALLFPPQKTNMLYYLFRFTKLMTIVKTPEHHTTLFVHQLCRRVAYLRIYLRHGRTFERILKEFLISRPTLFGSIDSWLGTKTFLLFVIVVHCCMKADSGNMFIYIPINV